MKLRFVVFSICAVVFLLLFNGCCGPCQQTVQRQFGESAVLIGEEPAALAHIPLPNSPIVLRDAYLPPKATINYTPTRDILIDYSAGTIRRIPGSRAPDFQTNILFGREQFDHSKFPGYGNRGFFIFVDYSFIPTNHWPLQPLQTQFLKKTKKKLARGETLKIVAFGDSIAAGGEATEPDLIFWKRWALQLQEKYPKARVTAINGATGGDTTIQGFQRLQAKVIAQKPDLVLIGFGMNDNNRFGVPLSDFKQNLKEMIRRIRAATGAEVILFSAFPPNPKWFFGSPHMGDYAAATKEAASETASAYADVFDNWQALAVRKKPEDMLGNNINHPNDFGHWTYFKVFEALGL